MDAVSQGATALHHSLPGRLGQTAAPRQLTGTSCSSLILKSCFQKTSGTERRSSDDVTHAEDPLRFTECVLEWLWKQK